MTLSSAFSLFFLLIGCTLVDDPSPSKDAPDLDFSKAQWVNEFQYDGVFNIKRYKNDYYAADFQFNGAEAKNFSSKNSKSPIENGYWFEPRMNKFISKYILKSLKTSILGLAKLNEKEVFYSNGYDSDGLSTLGNIETNNFLKYDTKIGLKWEVTSVHIPDNEDMKKINKLSPSNQDEFKIIKGGIKIFPKPISLEQKYTMPSNENQIKIAVSPVLDADLVYVKLTFDGASGLKDLGPLGADGFLRYYKSDLDQIVIDRFELNAFLHSQKAVTMTVQAIKFYTATKGDRKFIFKNIGESKAQIILE